MKKIQEKKKKQSKKRLGMGLSSLLSKDEGLASVIKAKIKTQIKNGGDSSDKNKPTFDLIKTSVDEKISSIKQISGRTNTLAIQNLVPGKFQPRKHLTRMN